LFVCKECHKNIHNGTYDGQKLTEHWLESLVTWKSRKLGSEGDVWKSAAWR
jgi:hypothetical protein